MDRVDALVIGGGPAGAAAATLLAGAGWSVLLAEARPFPRRKVCGEYLSATNGPLLAHLGVADAFADLAGPPVERTALFVGNRSVVAPLPRLAGTTLSWGRALSRDVLDSLLLDNARQRGVEVRQPARCVRVQARQANGAGADCRLELHDGKDGIELEARATVVIAAHGSWDIGPLQTQRRPAAPRPGDWMAFKAHLRDCDLPADLMPLLSFPGGYGGMVHCDRGLTSISCCLRRRRLENLPRATGESAGDAVFRYLQKSLPVLRPFVERASVVESWLSAGPIQPGLRPCFRDGVFVVGNAAGEAHPVVAEGISMAMQSGWLLAEALIPLHSELHDPAVAVAAGAAYQRAWRRAFAGRIRIASAVAAWASHPRCVAPMLPFLRTVPSLLAWGARLSGKSSKVVLEKESKTIPSAVERAAS